MSKLSDFLGGSGGGGIYLGYIETADGAFEKIADGAGVAVLDYSSGDVLLSDDGATSSAVNTGSPYFPYLNGLWVRNNAVFSSNVASSFPTPGNQSFDISVDPLTGNLISCDPGTDLIYVHDGISAAILDSFSAPGSEVVVGVAVDPATGNLVSCDDNSTVYIHDGISATILDSFSTPGVAARGIAIDPSTGNLISCAAGNDLIYIHDGISSTVLSSFNPPGPTSLGLTVDTATGNLISCDGGTDLIYTHDGISENILRSISAPGGSANGVAFNPITFELISADSISDMIYIHANTPTKFALALTEATA